jgi:hypothetical protein
VIEEGEERRCGEGRAERKIEERRTKEKLSYLKKYIYIKNNDIIIQ